MSRKKRGEDRSEPRAEAGQAESEEVIENTEDVKANLMREKATAEADAASGHPVRDTKETGGSALEGDAGDKQRGGDESVLIKQVSELKDELCKLNDQLLRKQADYENFRKRMARERDESVRYANQMLLLDLVEIIDDFERAIKSSEESKDFDSFHSGVVLIEKQFVSMLEKKWGLSRFESTGEVFDPEKHQAIASEEVEDHDHSIVLEDYQKGYLLHDRVLRPAKVKVSQPKSSAAPESSSTIESAADQGERNGKNNWN